MTHTAPTMETLFKRERPFGKERFRGLVRWTKDDGVVTRVFCSDTWANKEFAQDDANRLMRVLQQRDWTKEPSQ